jgi:hypothetical protein
MPTQIELIHSPGSSNGDVPAKTGFLPLFVPGFEQVIGPKLHAVSAQFLENGIYGNLLPPALSVLGILPKTRLHGHLS